VGGETGGNHQDAVGSDPKDWVWEGGGKGLDVGSYKSYPGACPRGNGMCGVISTENFRTALYPHCMLLVLLLRNPRPGVQCIRLLSKDPAQGGHRCRRKYWTVPESHAPFERGRYPLPQSQRLASQSPVSGKIPTSRTLSTEVGKGKGVLGPFGSGEGGHRERGPWEY